LQCEEPVFAPRCGEEATPTPLGFSTSSQLLKEREFKEQMRVGGWFRPTFALPQLFMFPWK
jgi:hypothetical protein